MKNPFENLQFIPEANIILHANYTVFKKKEEEKKKPYSDFPFLTSPTGSGLQPLLLFVPIPTNPLSHLSPVMVASLLLLIQERHVLPEGFYIPVCSSCQVSQVGHTYRYSMPVWLTRSTKCISSTYGVAGDWTAKVSHMSVTCLHDWPPVKTLDIKAPVSFPRWQ